MGEPFATRELLWKYSEKVPHACFSFLESFFFKKKAEPCFLMQSLLFFLLSSRHMAGQAPEREKEKGLAIEKMTSNNIFLQQPFSKRGIKCQSFNFFFIDNRENFI